MAATLPLESPGLVIQRCRPPRQSWSAGHARSPSHDLTATHMCLPIATWQAAVAVLLMKADLMFPEGHGAPRAFTRDGTAAKKTNELLENASAAIDKLFEQRGYDPKKPEQLKASLGYALDHYEATAYLVTGTLHLPLLSPQEARAIGKRIANVIGMSGSVGAKLKALRKRGKAAAPQIAALLHAPATLNLEPPPRNSTASPAPPPAPPPPPVPLIALKPAITSAARVRTGFHRICLTYQAQGGKAALIGPELMCMSPSFMIYRPFFYHSRQPYRICGPGAIFRDFTRLCDRCGELEWFQCVPPALL